MKTQCESGNFGNITTGGNVQINYQGKKVKVTANNFRVFWHRPIHPITMIRKY